MFRRHSGGFALVEFAIALPLLILLGWGLATVSLKIFQLGRDQVADYVLETEAQYVLERLTRHARAARAVEVQKLAADIDQIKFVYHVAENDSANQIFNVNDVWQTRYFIPGGEGGIYTKLYAERQNKISGNPITGVNSFGDTKVNKFKFAELNDNVLHITLEMESVNTGRKIKICTAIFMPGCISKEGLERG